MLDIKFIRENREQVEQAAKNKNIALDFDALLELDKERIKLLQEVEEFKSMKNSLNDLIKQAKSEQERNEIIEKGKEIKTKLEIKEPQLRKVMDEFEALMVRVPNVVSPDTPIGKSDAENVEVKKHGEPTKFSFEPKDHIQLGKDLDILDLEKGAEVAGYRGYYVKNEGVSLMMALMMYGMNKMIEKGFAPMIPPTLVKGGALFGTGYFKGKEFDPEVDEIYQLAEGKGEAGKEKKFLIGTAEPSLLAYYSNEVLNEEKLPLRVCGYSQCYRSEIGSYGKDTKGLYRVHEFMKVEQVVITRADVSEANNLQDEMIAITEEIHEELGLPYRVLQICTGDMGAGKYRMFDIEAWMPSRNGYGETGSASNFLDWQSRRLNVKYMDENGDKKFAYMLNNTALPSPRPFIAILENFQQADGSVVIPEVLRKWMPGNMDVIRKK
ncbi:MAG: Serine-tRNA ligase [Candidatus Moranbacteria bacterium GW2011_GWE1_49_15]|nr:MAG: Serine-tRNA ligase [Candidatus Moranbacteria bacterium GW2011_GWE2_47_10]KKW06490.1 MAG: Serine-tRNA ligase [Candidatus Moranbacteria bacterium GW2011_GWE1_49_15]HBP01101.1 serine--tRNA ligase [Candidatus Moranbacteria bacterium]